MACDRGVLKAQEELKIERRLHLAKVIKLSLGAVAGRVLLSVGDVFLGVLDRLIEHIRPKLGEVDRGLGKHGKA